MLGSWAVASPPFGPPAHTGPSLRIDQHFSNTHHTVLARRGSTSHARPSPRGLVNILTRGPVNILLRGAREYPHACVIITQNLSGRRGARVR